MGDHGDFDPCPNRSQTNHEGPVRRQLLLRLVRHLCMPSDACSCLLRLFQTKGTTSMSFLLHEAALKLIASGQCERRWRYIPGPLMGDVRVETRPADPGRSMLRIDPAGAIPLDPGPLGEYLALVSPGVILELFDELERIRTSLDEVIKERDKAQRQLRVYEESDRAAARAKIAHLKEHYPK